MKKLRLVRKEGGSRVISFSEIPADWKAVELQVLKATKECLTVRIDRVQ